MIQQCVPRSLRELTLLRPLRRFGAAFTFAALIAVAGAASGQTPDEEDVEIRASASASAPAASASAPIASAPPALPPAPLAASSAPPSPAAAAAPRAPAPATPRPEARGHCGLDFKLSAYVQAQFETHQDSEDQLRQGGALYNQNRFLVRRARLRIEREWQWAGVLLELDGNTVKGATAGLRKAEASVAWRRSGAPLEELPLVRLAMGLFDVPFGYELTESPRVRPFMERTLMSRALFPGEPDVGVRLSGGLGFFRYAVAVVNGEPLDERSGFAGMDPNANKDVVARFGADTRAGDRIALSGGISMLKGKGFHAGTDATKSQIIWRDLNENGNIDAGETTGVPGTAAVASKVFERWAVGADLQAGLRWRLGWVRAFGGVTIANNLDRGLFVADPTETGIDAREFGYYAALTQEVTRFGLIGFRFDAYDPNADAFIKRAGKLLPSTQRMQTLSPLAALVLPDRARLVVQYDFVRDYLARDGRGVPTDLKNNVLTLRLQVEL